MFRRKNLAVLLLASLFLAFAWGLFFLKGHYVVPILMYHSVTPKAQANNRLAVTQATFNRQMEFLKHHQYNVLPVNEVVGLIKHQEKIPPKTVSITFDDGYADVYLYAFPILKKYALPATVFLIVNEIGRIQDDRLSWPQIKEMRDSGLITFGSHAMGPDPLYKMKSDEELRYQIFASRQKLEQELGTEITLFSYPEGMFDQKIRQLVIDAGYAGAVATTRKGDFPFDDCFALRRLRISENSGNLFIFAAEASGYYAYFKERKKMRHGKK